MADVFVSYSRKDKVFVQKLHEALKQAERDAWVDWEDIPLTAEWWAEIQEGIERANNFVFIISPDSVASTVCGQEVAHAVKHNKRIIPLLHREAQDVPETLGKLNWLFCRGVDDFNQFFTNLLKTMDTNLEWLKTHTRLTRRAVEWDKKERNESYLLRGDDLLEAEQWHARAGKNPPLTQLQRDYILASRHKQDADQERELAQARSLAEKERQRAEEQIRYTAQLRRRGWIIIGALVGVLVLSLCAFAFSYQAGTYIIGAESLITTITRVGDTETNSDICWVGGLYSLHEEVLPACHRAVELEPDYWYHYESRGLVLALVGDYPAASADFRQAIALAQEVGEAQDDIANWEIWAAQLGEGNNPFDIETIEKLKGYWEEQFAETADELQ